MMIRRGKTTGKIVELTDKTPEEVKLGDIPEDVAAMLNAGDDEQDDD